MAVELKSEYMLQLSLDSRARYEKKVINCGLFADPYALTEWTSEPSEAPAISWSDIMIYMVATPSPYTKEALKVT